jgi:CO/xanthine dehydrogenase Mo-binding subunit
VHECFGTAVGCAVDVSIEDGRPRIHRATAAIGVGWTVNPLTIESQVQGGLAFGLIQLMAKGAITFKDGQVEQRISTTIPAYMKDSPVAVDVHIVPSVEAPIGCGEPPVPVIAPAVANVLFRLTGKVNRSHGVHHFSISFPRLMIPRCAPEPVTQRGSCLSGNPARAFLHVWDRSTITHASSFPPL